jgi:hypothetical protein
MYTGISNSKSQTFHPWLTIYYLISISKKVEQAYNKTWPFLEDKQNRMLKCNGRIRDW